MRLPIRLLLRKEDKINISLGSISVQIRRPSRVSWALTVLPAELDAAGACGSQTELHPIADQVPLELGQARHDGAHQMALAVLRSKLSPV